MVAQVGKARWKMVQRGQQNSLEWMPLFLTFMMLGGIRHPIISAVLSSVYIVTQYFYFIHCRSPDVSHCWELEKKRKERAQEVYEKKKQSTKLRVKDEKLAEEKLGSQLDIIAPVKY